MTNVTQYRRLVRQGPKLTAPIIRMIPPYASVDVDPTWSEVVSGYAWRKLSSGGYVAECRVSGAVETVMAVVDEVYLEAAK